MSIESLFIHTATVSLASGDVTDAHGNTLTLSTANNVSIPCRLIERTERVWRDERAQLETVTEYVLLIPNGQSDSVRDWVGVSVSDHLGASLGSFVVDGIINRRGRGAHHTSVRLRRVA